MKALLSIDYGDCSLLDLGKLCAYKRGAREVPTHPTLHQEARILWVHQGQGLLQLQEREYVLSENTLVLLLPWQVSCLTRVDAPIEYETVIFRFAQVNRWIKA